MRTKQEPIHNNVIDLGNESEASSDVDYKERLLEALEQITGNGSFASSGQLEPIEPKFKVPNIGEITIPLGQDQAEQLMKVCHQSPFGKGTETIVDLSVRNTLELNADQFEISNPAWEDFITALTEKVVNELGVVGGADEIQAELYRKKPGMFATLVIGLPSEHIGGAVKLEHGSQTKVFHTAHANQSYLCWYADVEHEIEPVISGFRWVLTYNLIKTGDAIPAQSVIPESEFQPLRQAITTYVQEQDQELLYMLEHEYTETSMNLNSLKGMDYIRGLALQQMCDEGHVFLFLASLQRTVNRALEETYDNYRSYRGYNYDAGDCECDEDSDCPHQASNEVDGEPGEIYDDELSLPRVVDMTGHEISTGLSVEIEQLLQECPFDDHEPDDAENEGFTGNEGATRTETYNDTVIIIVSRSKLPNSLFKGARGGYRLDKATRQLTTIRERCKAVQGLLGESLDNRANFPSTEAKFEGLDAWVVEILEDIIVNHVKPHADDAKWLVAYLQVQRDPEKDLERVCTAVLKNVKRSSLPLAFLDHLFILARDGKFPQEAAKISFAEIAHDLATSLNICYRPTDWDTPKAAPAHYHRPRKLPAREPPVNGVKLALVIAEATDYVLHDTVSVLLNRVAQEVRKIHTDDFHLMIFPFLHAFIGTLLQRKAVMAEAKYQTFFSTVLNAYLDKYVQPEPARPASWVRDRVNCNCRDCKLLNDFLYSPWEQSGRFAMAEKRRRDLRHKLDGKCFKFDTERRGSPHTLVVTKTQEWAQRSARASEEIGKINTLVKLSELLGPGWEVISEQRNVKLQSRAGASSAKDQILNRERREANHAATMPHAHMPSFHPSFDPWFRDGYLMAPLNNTTGNAQLKQQNGPPQQAQVAGTKRKAVVIDLTSEE
ncbi:hypothetical protein EJ08DRAFT_697123 [Tothia fuscella]|uniref:Prolyl 4-hydroxylase alpha subunit Fe(2+) 2OG dioxygenase domain-containing protein n=1 Tax=Tothia fuscella TaxID=1048955 RepID=A0A9P4TYT4_9PEZI|nr:hypothetical protein EJ08DRAFT_697123 [Tothia fuscella]